MKWNGYKTRICCGTTYDCHHRNDCTVRGDEARAAMPCEITADGWCRSHSTGAGPAYCATTPTTPDEGTDPMTSHEEAGA